MGQSGIAVVIHCSKRNVATAPKPTREKSPDVAALQTMADLEAEGLLSPKRKPQ